MFKDDSRFTVKHLWISTLNIYRVISVTHQALQQGSAAAPCVRPPARGRRPRTRQANRLRVCATEQRPGVVWGRYMRSMRISGGKEAQFKVPEAREKSRTRVGPQFHE